MQRIRATLAEQDGVISRRQAVECGLNDNDIRRLVRTRELTAIHPGVYVEHTGKPSWHQLAWAAVLACWPAALSHASALRAANGPGRRDDDAREPVHVAVGRGRNVAQPVGVRVHHVQGLSARTSWNRSPPRVRIEEAALDLAAEAPSEVDAVAVLAEVVSSRQTTAARLLGVLECRKRISRRDFLRDVLTDVAEGTCSALEHGYLVLVERAHGLPKGIRQAVDLSRGTLYRDVLYADFQMYVELDARLFHTGAHHRDRDLTRDLDAAVDGLSGVRLGWGQVFRDPCATAAKIGAILRARGWQGNLRRCPQCGARDTQMLSPSA